MASVPYSTAADRAGFAPQVNADFATLSVTATSSSPYGLSSEAEVNALVAQVKSLTAALVAAGLIAAS